jgi:hypothetical protein
MTAGSPKAVLFAILIVACHEPSAPARPTTVTSPPTGDHASSQPLPSADPLKSKPEGRLVSEAELVAVLVESNFQRSTYEVAKDKLISIGTARESRPIDEAIEIRADATEAHFLVSYVRAGTGGWQFSYARATKDVPDALAATECYERLEADLSRRFGKPAWAQSAGGPPPTKGWNVGDGALEVSLLQRKDERGNAVLEITLAEPEGEPE